MFMTIFATHGIVGGALPSRFVDRNLLDTQLFINHLRSRREPYVSLSDCLDGKGDALTLDDSTVAAADAARLAQHLGHKVTLFVNGFHVASARPYFFARLNVALDSAVKRRITFKGKKWLVDTTPNKEAFRVAVKGELATIGKEDNRDELVTEVAHLLGISEVTVPHHLKTITEEQLKDLVRLGIDIQNHGWTHTRRGALPAEEHELDIRKGRQWLQEVCATEAHYYAIPNGDGLPFVHDFTNYSAWFLLSDIFRNVKLPARVFNRTTLQLDAVSQ